jgi:hypothetical protein
MRRAAGEPVAREAHWASAVAIDPTPELDVPVDVAAAPAGEGAQS